MIQDVPLERVGLQGMLHLTLLLRGGTLRIDSAMLTPGALTIKSARFALAGSPPVRCNRAAIPGILGF